MATYFLLLLQINRKTSHPFIWFYSVSVWFRPFSGSIQGTFIWLIQTPNLLSFSFHPCMSSPIFSNNVKECVSLAEEDNPIAILLLANLSASPAARGGWGDEDGIAGIERKGKALKIEKECRKSSRINQLMRFAVAERKRDLKNSVELQVLYNSRKLHSLLCTTLSTVRLLFSYLLFHNQPCFLASKSTMISL